MKAEPVYRTKIAIGRGQVHIVIWRLPARTKQRPHGVKYRLVYVVDGQRIVGYDNETGKGDHKHIGKLQSPYRFVDIPTLLADFWADVRAAK